MFSTSYGQYPSSSSSSYNYPSSSSSSYNYQSSSSSSYNYQSSSSSSYNYQSSSSSSYQSSSSSSYYDPNAAACSSNNVGDVYYETYSLKEVWVIESVSSYGPCQVYAMVYSCYDTPTSSGTCSVGNSESRLYTDYVKGGEFQTVNTYFTGINNISHNPTSSSYYPSSSSSYYYPSSSYQSSSSYYYYPSSSYQSSSSSSSSSYQSSSSSSYQSSSSSSYYYQSSSSSYYQSSSSSYYQSSSSSVYPSSSSSVYVYYPSSSSSSSSSTATSRSFYINSFQGQGVHTTYTAYKYFYSRGNKVFWVTNFKGTKIANLSGLGGAHTAPQSVSNARKAPGNPGGLSPLKYPYYYRTIGPSGMWVVMDGTKSFYGNFFYSYSHGYGNGNFWVAQATQTPTGAPITTPPTPPPITTPPTTQAPTTQAPTTQAPTTAAPVATTGAPITPAPTSQDQDGSAEDVRKQLKETGEATSELDTSNEESEKAAKSVSPKLAMMTKLNSGVKVKKKDIISQDGLNKKQAKAVIKAWFKTGKRSSWTAAKKKKVQKEIMKAKFGSETKDKVNVVIGEITTSGGDRRHLLQESDTVNYEIIIDVETADELVVILDTAEEDDTAFGEALSEGINDSDEFADEDPITSIEANTDITEIEVINTIAADEACGWLL